MYIYIFFFYRTLLLLVTVGGCFAEQEKLGSGLRVLYSVYRQCEDSNDSFTCLKARAVKLIDRAISAESIPIIDGKKNKFSSFV